MFCRWDTETSNESIVPKDHKWNENDKKNLAPAYIESLIEVTTENLKKSTAVIEKQNSHQESISKSIHEINRIITDNTSLNNV